jgi:Tfp pilus assembly protein PilF
LGGTSKPAGAEIAAKGPSASPATVPESVRSVLAMARLTERRGQVADAERLYLDVIAKSPDVALPHHRLGVIRTKQGRFQEAEQHFARAMALAPANAELLSDVGHFYYLNNSPQQAEQCLRRALELAPNDARASNNLAVMLAEQGRYEESLAMFRRNGTEARAHANIAYMYAQQGEMERAAEHYSRALTLDGTMRPAAQALVQLARYLPENNGLPPTPGALALPEAIAEPTRRALTGDVVHVVARDDLEAIRPREAIMPGGAETTPRPRALVNSLDEASANLLTCTDPVPSEADLTPCGFRLVSDGDENGDEAAPEVCPSAVAPTPEWSITPVR